jgi:hypothetical protein
MPSPVSPVAFPHPYHRRALLSVLPPPSPLELPHSALTRRLARSPPLPPTSHLLCISAHLFPIHPLNTNLTQPILHIIHIQVHILHPSRRFRLLCPTLPLPAHLPFPRPSATLLSLNPLPLPNPTLAPASTICSRPMLPLHLLLPGFLLTLPPCRRTVEPTQSRTPTLRPTSKITFSPLSVADPSPPTPICISKNPIFPLSHLHLSFRLPLRQPLHPILRILRATLQAHRLRTPPTLFRIALSPQPHPRTTVPPHLPIRTFPPHSPSSSSRGLQQRTPHRTQTPPFLRSASICQCRLPTEDNHRTNSFLLDDLI